MKEITKDYLIEMLYRALPYSEQIKELDSKSEETAIRFTWRSNRFRVTISFHVETVKGGCLHGDDISIVLSALLKKQYVAELDKELATATR